MTIIVIIALMSLAFAAGNLYSNIIHKKEIVMLTEAHKAEIDETHSKAWDIGWKSASTSVTNVHDRYREIFPPIVK